MNLLSLFGNFYSNLSSDGLFFFWIIVFLLCFLIFLAIVLILKNKKLTKLLEEEKNSSNDILEKEISTLDNNKLIDKKEEILFEEKNNIREVKKIEEKQEIKQEETGPYKKNVLREMNTRTQTSPISISSKDVIYNENEIDKDYYDLDESCLRENSISPLEKMEDTYEVNDNMKFASEIVKKMEEEIKPSNIELTDYEKKQEEDAIISYDELLKVKDKIYNITDDEETDEFIDELKSFRLDL